MGQSTQQYSWKTKQKQNRHYCINISFTLVLTLHVSAPILGHHQAYNDPSLSSWIASNFNTDKIITASYKSHRKWRWNGWHSCFVFRRCWCQLVSQRLAVLVQFSGILILCLKHHRGYAILRVGNFTEESSSAVRLFWFHHIVKTEYNKALMMCVNIWRCHINVVIVSKRSILSYPFQFIIFHYHPPIRSYISYELRKRGKINQEDIMRRSGSGSDDGAPADKLSIFHRIQMLFFWGSTKKNPPCPIVFSGKQQKSSPTVRPSAVHSYITCIQFCWVRNSKPFLLNYFKAMNYKELHHR
jgi:hypothetical protein